MYKRIAPISILIAAACLTFTPALSMTVDEVLAKHIEASGGREAWAAIESVKITGTFTSFSKEAPFTLHRKRDNRYHMDHVQDDKLVVIGVAGDTAWWDNHWFQVGAQPITGLDLAVVIREAQFEPALFYVGSEGGGSAELLGEVELEGVPAIGIKLTLPGEAIETWYLDPETFLAVARDSTGSDFGNPQPRRTFFEDYREVSGVKIPHYSESQWYTRDRVMRIEAIETNLEIDDGLFAVPAPPGMDVLAAMDGEFKVLSAQRQSPDAPWIDGERRSKFTNMLSGTLVQEIFDADGGGQVLRSITYDRLRERYRMTEIDSAGGMLDVLEGGFDENGERLTMSNVESGTTWSSFGMTFNTRFSFFDITGDGFKLEYELSTDGGENWAVLARAEYSRD